MSRWLMEVVLGHLARAQGFRRVRAGEDNTGHRDACPVRDPLRTPLSSQHAPCKLYATQRFSRLPEPLSRRSNDN
jgi:hypothetical protein